MRFISNPRQAPRVPARLRVEMLHRGIDFRAETEDVGPKGCLVVSPKPLDPGAWVRLMLEADRLPEKLRVTGRVAWATQPARYRGGVAFAEMQVERNQDPFAWFDRLMQTSPGLVPLTRHVPDRLPLDTPLYLLPPPRFNLDLSVTELGLVAGMRNGTSVEKLLQRLPQERKNEGRLIFALLARRVLTLAAREACDPMLWRPMLQQAGVLSGLEMDDEPDEVVWLANLTVEEEAEEVVRLADMKVELEPAQAAPSGDILPSWLSEGRQGPRRSPQAQQHYDHALASAARGDLQGAIKLLRQALVLSPRDGEIARALGELAFRDRKAPGR
ncbi:MAG TPA: PilZ domain-containing protein [Anaeromyxobacteraceae bacterium]|nr:PilZ domain-containing protein [Anaeromyxobacteraceae bacterium]